MKSPRRWWKRRKELALVEPIRKEVQEELSRALGKPCKLISASAKGGYDEIFYAESADGREAVVRVNSPYKTQDDPVGVKDPGVPLPAAARIDREWAAYTALGEAGLSPKPLWRNDRAMACSWVPWGRLSRLLTRERDQFWPMMKLTMPLIARMHQSGVIHLDLNLGNLLVSPEKSQVMVIDFEFGEVDWVTIGQQKAFDYLRFIDDGLKKRRGGDVLKSAPEKLVGLLDPCLDSETRNAELSFVFEKLTRLANEPELCARLLEVFPKLGSPA